MHRTPAQLVRERPVRPRYVHTVELTAPGEDLAGLDAYESVEALVCIRGIPIGVVRQPVVGGCCSAVSLRRAALNDLHAPILRHLLVAVLARGLPAAGIDVDRLRAALSAPAASAGGPAVTVVVCTRDRPARLARALDAIAHLDPPADEVIVVDNAPGTDETAKLVAAYPAMRRVLEPVPGLDRARARGAREARCAIVAFTDDDAAVDRGWVGALRRAFRDPEVDAVTGLVLPLELETPAQALFERYGGFGRGFVRQRYRVDLAGGERPVAHAGTGKFGTGANMAFRRSLFDRIGSFDPALDVGTPANGGGDLEMFYRVISGGHTLVYEPSAIVRHAHRRTLPELREQLANHGVGFYAFLTRTAQRNPGDAFALARFGAWWFWRWSVRRLLQTWFKPGMFPRDLVLAELYGSLRGPRALLQARRQARRLDGAGAAAPRRAAAQRAPRRRVVRRTIDIGQPVGALDDVADARVVRIEVVRGGSPVGRLTLEPHGRAVGAAAVREAIVNALGLAVLDERRRAEGERVEAVSAALRELFPGSSRASVRPLDPDASVSVVIATRDRPGDLRRALESIANEHPARRIEIVVVDNHPESGLTPPAAAGVPNVRVVSERRAGLSYARNRGILASTGSIVIATDDDVIVPPGWIERLVAPFRDPNVMAVTGNVVAASTDGRPERLFEAYGGLGRGTDSLRVDGAWFREFRRAVPTWRLGGTANAAFRASIFRDPAIGLLDESLGAGTPSGCSEDTDLFYRILRAGYRIVYEPAAAVRHRHRDTMRALRRQIYAYAKGHVAYQLTTLTREGDLRAIVRLALEMPELYWWRIRTRISGRSEYPLSLVLVEIAGFLAGPWAWWRSRRRARRLKLSAAGVARPA